jgi:MFS family permease
MGAETAEANTILPLIVDFFGAGKVIVGLFSAIFRGGNILLQLYTAFYVQQFRKVIKSLRIIFLVRLLSWFGIGLFIYFFGENNVNLTLWLIGFGLFIFSFSAGIGTIYFNELLGKIFTPKYRGVTLAYRQFCMGLGGVLAGFITAFFLNTFDKPLSFAFLFMISAGVISLGYLIFSFIKEPPKVNILVKEEKFSEFLKKALKVLKKDTILKYFIITRLLSLSYLLVFPFIVINAKPVINSYGILTIGSLIPFQIGLMTGNIFWGRLSSKGKDRQVKIYAFILMICALITAIFAKNIYGFVIVFFLAGLARDGYRLSYNNEILTYASEEKRPMYWAIFNNITSLGLFLSIPGGALLNLIGFRNLLIVSIGLLFIGLILVITRTKIIT